MKIIIKGKDILIGIYFITYCSAAKWNAIEVIGIILAVWAASIRYELVEKIRGLGYQSALKCMASGAVMTVAMITTMKVLEKIGISKSKGELFSIVVFTVPYMYFVALACDENKPEDRNKLQGLSKKIKELVDKVTAVHGTPIPIKIQA